MLYVSKGYRVYRKEQPFLGVNVFKISVGNQEAEKGAAFEGYAQIAASGNKLFLMLWKDHDKGQMEMECVESVQILSGTDIKKLTVQLIADLYHTSVEFE